MSPNSLTSQLKQQARRLGFDDVGVCPAVEPKGVSQLAEWLARGYAGEMRYVADRQAAYAHPRHVLEGVRSLVLLTTNYQTQTPTPSGAGQGSISRYAWGSVDYHDLIHARLKKLKRWLETTCPGSISRGVVDTAPLLERSFAQLAGLGWQGKNTLLLNREAGSLFFLAALLTDVELDYDQPHAADHCGTCTACLDACPTRAFPEPYVLDARKCISYLTIELRGDIPEVYRPQLDGWLFGCDICQDVCPWNRNVPLSNVPEFSPTVAADPVDLCEILQLDEAAFRARFRKTPLWRAKRAGVLRNAAILLGTQRHLPAEDCLIGGLADQEPLVRTACSWALGKFGTSSAMGALADRLKCEPDPRVQGEIQAALARAPSARR